MNDVSLVLSVCCNGSFGIEGGTVNDPLSIEGDIEGGGGGGSLGIEGSNEGYSFGSGGGNDDGSFGTE